MLFHRFYIPFLGDDDDTGGGDGDDDDDDDDDENANDFMSELFILSCFADSNNPSIGCLWWLPIALIGLLAPEINPIGRREEINV